MKFLKLNILLATFFILFTFTGCSPQEQALLANVLAGNSENTRNTPNRPIYQDNRNNDYKVGTQDGCSSKRGKWRKNSYNYRNNPNYRRGWDRGYTQCRKDDYNNNNYYDQGNNDGCRSGQGRYIKDSYRYNNYSSYRNGWNNGYNRCKRNHQSSTNYYNLGNTHGCSSARGRYLKDSTKYNRYATYRNGWNEGYNRCKRRYY